MRYSVLFATAAMAFGLAACSHERAEDGGPATARSFTVSGFDKIEVSGPYSVEVTTGGQPKVTAQGPAAIVNTMVVAVEGDTLKIHPEKRSGSMFGWGNAGSYRNARVAVSVPMLTAVAIGGSGDVVVNRIATDSFHGAVAGSGGLRLPQVEVQSLALEIAGSGDVVAAGRASEAKYHISGSGDINAGQLASEQAQVEIAGSGNIQANASSTASVEIAGSGNVRVTGGAKCTIDKAGSGDVQCS